MERSYWDDTDAGAAAVLVSMYRSWTVTRKLQQVGQIGRGVRAVAAAGSALREQPLAHAFYGWSPELHERVLSARRRSGRGDP